MSRSSSLKRTEVLRILADYSHLVLPVGNSKPAAVLVPLRILADESIEVIFTRRAQHLNKHAGQVSFPGGAVEAGDTNVVATALREAHEEVGLEPRSVEVVGRLNDSLTITQFHVAQIVGIVPTDVELKPASGEVERIFSVPLDVVLTDAAWHRKERTFSGVLYRLWYLEHDGEEIWGVTGAMLRDFAELLWANGV